MKRMYKLATREEQPGEDLEIKLIREIIRLKERNELLQSQLAELLPWAYKYLGPRSFANALGDEGEDLLSRIEAGEFGDV